MYVAPSEQAELPGDLCCPADAAEDALAQWHALQGAWWVTWARAAAEPQLPLACPFMQMQVVFGSPIRPCALKWSVACWGGIKLALGRQASTQPGLKIG